MERSGISIIKHKWPIMKKFIKCIVTGGAGFIGSHLCDRLIDKGYEVYCIDNLMTGSPSNIRHLVSNPRFYFIKHDITVPLPSAILPENTDKHHPFNVKYIYHLASPASPPQYRKYALETLLVNSMGTFNMLELSRKHDSHFLLASTSEVYGNPLIHPQKENYYGNVNPVGMRSCYDESKRFAEAITMEYVRIYRQGGRIIRIFNTYGPRMQPEDGRVISNFIIQSLTGNNLTMYGTGNQTRSFCYVDDMVRGLILAMEKEGTDGEVINLGNPEEKSIREIGALIIKLTNSQSKLIVAREKEKDDPDKRKPDITKAVSLLNWKPVISLESGLIKTINYFKNI